MIEKRSLERTLVGIGLALESLEAVMFSFRSIAGRSSAVAGDQQVHLEPGQAMVQLRRLNRAASQLPGLGALNEWLVDRRLGEFDETLEHLASCWFELSSEDQAEVLEAGASHWRVLLPRLFSSDEADTRLAATLIAGQVQEPVLADQIERLLTDEDARVSEGVARVLSEMAQAHNRWSSFQDSAVEAGGVGGVVGVGVLESAVVRACQDFDHHRKSEALLAALALLGPWCREAGPGTLMHFFAENESHPGILAMRQVLRTAEMPEMDRWAYHLCTLDALRGSAGRRISQIKEWSRLEPLLDARHLLVHPVREEQFGVVLDQLRGAWAGAAGKGQGSGSRSALLPALGVRSGWSVRQRLGLVRWLTMVSMTARQRDACLSSLLLDPSPRVRFELFRVGTHGVAADLCFDGDRRVSVSACLRWSRVGLTQPWVFRDARSRRVARVCKALGRSPVRAVRQIARQELSRLELFDVECAQSRVLARRALSARREPFIAMARDRLISGTPEQRINVVLLASMLGFATELELEMLTLLGKSATNRGDSSIHRVASAVVLALGSLTSTSARGAVRASLGHSDTRVRANAVEAIVKRARNHAVMRADADEAVMVDFCMDNQHRARANSIRGLIETDIAAPANRGIQSLRSMLTDDRTMHRVAGVWLADRLAPVIVESTAHRADRSCVREMLMQISRDDDEPALRKRAAAGINRYALLDRLNWSQHAVRVV